MSAAGNEDEDAPAPASRPPEPKRPDRWKLLGLTPVKTCLATDLTVIDVLAHALSKYDAFDDPVEAVLASVETDLDTLALLSGESAHVPSVLSDTLDALSRRVRAAILLLRKSDEIAARQVAR